MGKAATKTKQSISITVQYFTEKKERSLEHISSTRFNQKDIVGEIRAEKKKNHRKFEKENCVELFVAKLKTLQQPTANCMDYSYM